MSDEIKKISNSLSVTNKIAILNDYILQLQGMIEEAKFNENEINQIIANLNIIGWENSQKYLRNISLGHTLTDYGNWSHYKAFSGYSIWKLAPSTYTYDDLNQLYLDDKIVVNMKQATAETSSFDKVFLGDSESGGTFVDNTTEASTQEGTSFDLMAYTTDYLYLGLSATFLGAKFEFATRGMGYDLVIEYYSSESGSWKELTSDLNNLEDNTNNFASDGLIKWDLPTDWATNEINGQTKYWIRISTIEVPTTVAEAYYIVPGNSVESLLALSSSEVLDETWKWCYYNNYVYVTIRNTGQPSHEGDAYITSSSSTINKQNFFIYNHEFKSDYQSSNYVEKNRTTTLVDSAEVTPNCDTTYIGILSASGDRLLKAPSGTPTDGQKLIIRHIAIGGNRTLSLEAAESGILGYSFTGDITEIEETLEGKIDYLGFEFNESKQAWILLAYSQGG